MRKMLTILALAWSSGVATAADLMFDDMSSFRFTDCTSHWWGACSNTWMAYGEDNQVAMSYVTAQLGTKVEGILLLGSGGSTENGIVRALNVTPLVDGELRVQIHSWFVDGARTGGKLTIEGLDSTDTVIMLHESMLNGGGASLADELRLSVDDVDVVSFRFSISVTDNTELWVNEIDTEYSSSAGVPTNLGECIAQCGCPGSYIAQYCDYEWVNPPPSCTTRTYCVPPSYADVPPANHLSPIVF